MPRSIMKNPSLNMVPHHKSTSPTRRTISPPRIGTRSPETGASTSESTGPQTSGTFQTNVNVRTKSKSPSPIRSSTTVESSWKSSLRNGQINQDHSTSTKSTYSQPYYREYHKTVEGDSDPYQNSKFEHRTESK